MKDGIFWFIVIVLFTFLFGNITQLLFSSKNESVEGTITNTVFHDKYMTVVFDNGKTYNIGYDLQDETEEIDLTVHSKMLIKLEYSSWWLTPNTDDVWGITKIVKVPS